MLLFLAINPCGDHFCTQLCLLSNLRPRYYTCHCQSGWKLDSDKRTCIKGRCLPPLYTHINSVEMFCKLAKLFYLSSISSICFLSYVFIHLISDEAPFLMVVRDSVIFGIPLDPTDPSNNAMAPVSGITQGRDIDFDDQEQYVYWVQSTVS